jgi:hypothetical protein
MSKVKRLSHESIQNGWTLDPTYNEMFVSDSIRFTLPEYYPFRPPVLLIDNTPHVQYLKRLYTRRKKIIDRHKYFIPCICCSTILCSWSPCNTCIQVYQEYTDYAKRLSYVDLLENMKQTNLDDLILERISSFLL